MPVNFRCCISCRCLAPKTQFWRVVRLAGTGEVQVAQADCLQAIPPMGRSAYLCPQRECLQTAQKKNRLAKALKTQVPNHIYAELWQRLERKELGTPTVVIPAVIPKVGQES